ncbi:hypothetical protein T439DRAFT_325904 [Meredithblackwellia eburnea MCA 4105]
MSSIAHAEAHQQDGDQTQHTEPGPERFEEGTANSHKLDDKTDQRSIANRLAAAEAKSKAEDDENEENRTRNPTDAARAHGNEPSRGAKIDEMLMKEEQEELERKGRA